MVNVCVCINIENMGYSCKGPVFNLQYWCQTLQLLVAPVSPKIPSSSLLGHIYMHAIQRQTLRDIIDEVKPVLQTGQQLCKEGGSDNWHLYQSLHPTKGKERHDPQIDLWPPEIFCGLCIYTPTFTQTWILTVKTDNAEEPIFLAMETQNKAVRQINQVHQSANSYIRVNLSVRCHKGP